MASIYLSAIVISIRKQAYMHLTHANRNLLHYPCIAWMRELDRITIYNHFYNVMLLQDLPLFPDTFSELHEPNYMASPFLEDPTDFTVSLDANSTTTCSSLVDMEPSTFNVANNPQLIPTPPPESAGSTPKHHGRGSPPAAAQPGGGCSPHHSNSTSNSASEYIKGSSLEESPVSSPSTCSLDLGGGCGGDAAGTFNGHNVIVEHHMQQHGTSNCNGASKNGTLSCTQVKVESNSNMMSDTEQDQHGSSISERAATGHLGSVSSDDDEDKEEDSQCSADGGDADDQSSTAGSPQAQSNIPKNVKLPQSKPFYWTCVWHYYVVSGLTPN